MTQRTTIGQTSTNRIIGVEVAYAIAFIRALSLRVSKFALEDLAPPTDRTKGIAPNDKNRRVRSLRIAASSASFALQRFGDARLGGIWR
ncbi:MAG: hypothetical protein DMF17_00050 [Verrucomicrobia bacterium]|nr:MAG: hypothetical protein DMF17_00050 [Verrucomicrobiota bacterium]